MLFRSLPLAWALTGGNRHDSTQLIPLLDRVPPVRGKVGRPRRRPDRLTADRAYDYPSRRRELRRRGIKAEIARRNTGPSGVCSSRTNGWSGATCNAAQASAGKLPAGSPVRPRLGNG